MFPCLPIGMTSDTLRSLIDHQVSLVRHLEKLCVMDHLSRLQNEARLLQKAHTRRIQWYSVFLVADIGFVHGFILNTPFKQGSPGISKSNAVFLGADLQIYIGQPCSLSRKWSSSCVPVNRKCIHYLLIILSETHIPRYTVSFLAIEHYSFWLLPGLVKSVLNVQNFSDPSPRSDFPGWKQP